MLVPKLIKILDTRRDALSGKRKRKSVFDDPGKEHACMIAGSVCSWQKPRFCFTDRYFTLLIIIDSVRWGQSLGHPRLLDCLQTKQKGNKIKHKNQKESTACFWTIWCITCWCGGGGVCYYRQSCSTQDWPWPVGCIMRATWVWQIWWQNNDGSTLSKIKMRNDW